MLVLVLRLRLKLKVMVKVVLMAMMVSEGRRRRYTTVRIAELPCHSKRRHLSGTLMEHDMI